MLGEPLASKYDSLGTSSEDKYGRHIAARRKEDEKAVVISVLDPQLKVGASDVAGVAQVSRSLAQCRLRSILHCLEAGKTEGGNYYLVFESTPFSSLKAFIRSHGSLAIDVATTVAWHLAKTLKAAFEQQIFHLDLTSSNVYVDPETLFIRIGRYGFSMLLPSYSPSRRNEPFHGSAEYLAPEVCSGRPGDASADLYALGIIMYEMVAGKPPFVSSSPATTIKRQVYEKPLPLRVAKPGIAGLDGYEPIVMKLLEKDPRRRHPDPESLLKDLEALRASHFPSIGFEEEPLREAPVEVLCLLEGVERRPEPQKVVAGAAEPLARETQIFTGLASEFAQATAQAASAEPVVQQPVEVSRPTELFDASLVEVALKDKEAQKAEHEEPREPITQSQVQAQVPVEQPVAETRPAEGEKAEQPPESEASQLSAQKAAEWFVESSQQLPESVFPPEEEERKESRTFWIIVGIVGVLLIAGAVTYFGTGRQTTPELPPPVAPRPAVAPTIQPPAPAIPDVGPAPSYAPSRAEPVPEPAPPRPSPEELRAQKVNELVALARKALEAGNLEEAKKATTEALAMDENNSEARILLAKIEQASRPPPTAERRRPAPEPRRPRDEIRLKPTPPPQVQPTPPVEEVQAKIKSLVRQGRDAYNNGDYQTAIKAFNQALELDPNNSLVKKLLEQAKAKANP